MYTDEKLAQINGTARLDQCIKKLFAPVNFVGRFADLDKFIADFNQYLAFDGWQVVREGKTITFKKAGDIDFEDAASEVDEDKFLQNEFSEIPIRDLGFDSVISNVLDLRLEEMKKCLNANAPLSVIFLAGSTLEGLLLGVASKHPKEFNQSTAAPKDATGKVKKFPDWTLANFIDVAHDLGLLLEDVKKFSHSLRDFRNYIHPYQQVSTGFNPNEHTAKICWQVLKAAIHQLVENDLSRRTKVPVP